MGKRSMSPLSPLSLTETETAVLLTVAGTRFPDWYPWLLCALRTGLRLGELIALQWGDVDWAGRFLQIQRNVYNSTISTPASRTATTRLSWAGQTGPPPDLACQRPIRGKP